MADGKTPKRDQPRDQYQVEFVGLKPGAERPDIVVQALDEKNQVIHSSEVGKDGVFKLPEDVLKKSHRVVVGASTPEGGVAKGALRYRSEEFAETVRGGTLALAEAAWAKLHFFWICVSGRVRLCRRRPWWYDQIFVALATPLKRLAVATKGVSRARVFANTAALSPAVSRASPSISDLIAWPYRCYTVCLGAVEVFRRTCCCHPIVFDDIRIDGLIRELEIIVARLPKFPPPRDGFPPPPPPPRVDAFKTPIFKGGALNEMALNAAHDLLALRTLPREQAVSYVSQRLYLAKWFCTCSQPAKVASGSINPDGTFNICWRDFPRIVSPHCHVEYAYVVKQTIGGVTTTIYNGLQAGIWFNEGEDALLTSYNPAAFTCNETGTPTGDAIVYLDLIGDTESHELITPDATEWDRVAAPASNSGLLFPNMGPNGHERNFGGALELTFMFSLAMRDPAVGAKYYRVSVSEADEDGNPIGDRVYYEQALAWKKVIGLNVEPESLGPAVVGTEAKLYRIPWVDEPWTGEGRYHALINTLDGVLNVPDGGDKTSPSKRHLVTLEVFNAAGERIRPLGTPATGQPGTEVAKPFKYQRWFQPSGSPGDDLTPVNFGALTHMFLWDNRPPVSDITRLVKNTVPSSEECQFLVGNGDATFAIEYESYVPDPRCLHDQSIGWVRGLNGSSANGGTGSLATPTPAANVGQFPDGPGTSGTNTFELMLTRLQPLPPVVLEKCSFAVTLVTRSKTTNGESFNYPYTSETAAFALQITPAPNPFS